MEEKPSNLRERGQAGLVRRPRPLSHSLRQQALGRNAAQMPSSLRPVGKSEPLRPAAVRAAAAGQAARPGAGKEEDRRRVMIVYPKVGL